MNSQNDTDDLSSRRLVWDFFMEEASRTHQRTDWFLLFHAILLEAFFSVKTPGPAASVVTSIGVFASYMWLMTGLRQRWPMMHLGLCVANATLSGSGIGSVFARIFEARRQGISRPFEWARPVAVFCVVTPATFLAGWIALIILADSQHQMLTLEVAALCCLLGMLFAGGLGAGPDIPPGLVDLVASEQKPPSDCTKVKDRSA